MPITFEPVKIYFEITIYFLVISNIVVFWRSNNSSNLWQVVVHFVCPRVILHHWLLLKLPLAIFEPVKSILRSPYFFLLLIYLCFEELVSASTFIHFQKLLWSDMITVNHMWLWFIWTGITWFFLSNLNLAGHLFWRSNNSLHLNTILWVFSLSAQTLWHMFSHANDRM